MADDRKFMDVYFMNYEMDINACYQASSNILVVDYREITGNQRGMGIRLSFQEYINSIILPSIGISF